MSVVSFNIFQCKFIRISFFSIAGEGVWPRLVGGYWSTVIAMRPRLMLRYGSQRRGFKPAWHRPRSASDSGSDSVALCHIRKMTYHIA